ncbi:MAG: hypothetical protein U0797_11595 [Gemmataceae bacterium]
MTWKGKHPLVELVGKSYCKGVKLTPEEMGAAGEADRSGCLAWRSGSSPSRAILPGIVISVEPP